MPSSIPIRKTLLNSRPFAECIVISTTRSSDSSSESISLTSAVCSRKSERLGSCASCSYWAIVEANSATFCSRSSCFSGSSPLSVKYWRYPVFSRISASSSDTEISADISVSSSIISQKLRSRTAARDKAANSSARFITSKRDMPSSAAICAAFDMVVSPIPRFGSFIILRRRKSSLLLFTSCK